MSKHKNVYGTVMTAVNHAANNRGENSGNMTTLQKCFLNGEEYTCVSAEALRFAQRKTMMLNGVDTNRVYDDQDEYTYKDPLFKSPGKYPDDWLFGFMDAKAMNKCRGSLSVSRAISLLPFLQEASYNCKGGKKEKAAVGGLSLYEAEMHTTAYQYTFGVGSNDVPKLQWVQELLKAITDICPVAGNHARFFYDFAPESIVLRVTACHSAGIQNCFEMNDGVVTLDNLMFKIKANDIDPAEIIVGGKITTSLKAQLTTAGVQVIDGVKAAAEAAFKMLSKSSK